MHLLALCRKFGWFLPYSYSASCFLFTSCLLLFPLVSLAEMLVLLWLFFCELGLADCHVTINCKWKINFNLSCSCSWLMLHMLVFSFQNWSYWMRGPNPKMHLAFSGLNMESLLRESMAVCSFLGGRGAVPRSGISFKTFRILPQVGGSFPTCSPWSRAIYSTLRRAFTLNFYYLNALYFFIWSLAARKKSKI